MQSVVRSTDAILSGHADAADDIFFSDSRDEVHFHFYFFRLKPFEIQNYDL